MLVGAHGSCINIYIGITFDHPDIKAPALKEGSQRRRGYTLPKAGAYTASDKNILVHVTALWTGRGLSSTVRIEY